MCRLIFFYAHHNRIAFAGKRFCTDVLDVTSMNCVLVGGAVIVWRCGRVVRNLLKAGVGLLSRAPRDPLSAAWIINTDTSERTELNTLVSNK